MILHFKYFCLKLFGYKDSIVKLSQVLFYYHKCTFIIFTKKYVRKSYLAYAICNCLLNVVTPHKSYFIHISSRVIKSRYMLQIKLASSFFSAFINLTKNLDK